MVVGVVEGDLRWVGQGNGLSLCFSTVSKHVVKLGPGGGLFRQLHVYMYTHTCNYMYMFM